MAFVKKFNDFKLFQPTAQETAAAEKTLAVRLEINRNFLKENPPPESLKISITGSFISAHAPDYIGVPTINWNVEDWCREFRTMKNYGLDTVIFQAAAWKELEECYYPSEILKDFEIFDVITPLIEAAQIEKMTLFLGGFGSIAGWNLLNEEKKCQEIELHKSVLHELSDRYGDKIDGFYFPCETAFKGERNAEHEAQYSKILYEFCRTAKKLLPGKKIIMSPASKYFSDRDDDFLNCWKNIFASCHPDILAPQDSIGCGGSNLSNQSAMWALWKKLADNINCTLWANIELFERRSFGGEDPFDSASPERVRTQLANIADHVDKCVSWEFSYFINGNANGSSKLRDFFK